MLSSLDYTLTKIKHKKVKKETFAQNWNLTATHCSHISLQLGKEENFIRLIYFLILLQGNFSNWRYLYAIEFKCIFLSFFSESVRKYISVKTHWHLNQLIGLLCISIFRFLWDRGLYQTGFSNNYRLTTENLDAQNNTADK